MHIHSCEETTNNNWSSKAGRRGRSSTTHKDHQTPAPVMKRVRSSSWTKLCRGRSWCILENISCQRRRNHSGHGGNQTQHSIQCWQSLCCLFQQHLQHTISTPFFCSRKHCIQAQVKPQFWACWYTRFFYCNYMLLKRFTNAHTFFNAIFKNLNISFKRETESWILHVCFVKTLRRILFQVPFYLFLPQMPQILPWSE